MWHACLGVCHLTWPFNGKVDLCLENREAPKVWRPAVSLFVTVSLLTQGSPCPTVGITKKAVSTHESLEEVMVGRKKRKKNLGDCFFSESFVSYPPLPLFRVLFCTCGNHYTSQIKWADSKNSWFAGTPGPIPSSFIYWLCLRASHVGSPEIDSVRGHVSFLIDLTLVELISLSSSSSLIF